MLLLSDIIQNIHLLLHFVEAMLCQYVDDNAIIRCCPYVVEVADWLYCNMVAKGTVSMLFIPLSYMVMVCWVMLSPSTQ